MTKRKLKRFIHSLPSFTCSGCCGNKLRSSVQTSQSLWSVGHSLYCSAVSRPWGIHLRWLLLFQKCSSATPFWLSWISFSLPYLCWRGSPVILPRSLISTTCTCDHILSVITSSLWPWDATTQNVWCLARQSQAVDILISRLVLHLKSTPSFPSSFWKKEILLCWKGLCTSGILNAISLEVRSEGTGLINQTFVAWSGCRWTVSDRLDPE